MTTTDSQTSNTIDGLSSDIHKAVESWSSKQLHPIFEAELSKVIQACVSNMNQEQKPESNTTSASNDRPNVTTFSKAFIRRRRAKLDLFNRVVVELGLAHCAAS
jgi:hypothetical protein